MVMMRLICHSNTRQYMGVMRKYDSLVAFDTPLKMGYFNIIYDL